MKNDWPAEAVAEAVHMAVQKHQPDVVSEMQEGGEKPHQRVHILQISLMLPFPFPLVDDKGETFGSYSPLLRPMSLTKVITFDSRGVSGHLNHICTHRGVKHYMRDRQYSASSTSRLTFFELVSCC